MLVRPVWRYICIYSFMAQIAIYDYLWVLILGTRSKVCTCCMNDGLGHKGIWKDGQTEREYFYMLHHGDHVWRRGV
jgi:hypothetical protein